jgi:hypothetical protein
MKLEIDCRRTDDGWSCEITVGDDSAATRHVVDVADADLERFPGATSPEALMQAAFDFLLTREPRDSILTRFELPLIGRYFPEWEREVAKRLSSS